MYNDAKKQNAIQKYKTLYNLIDPLTHKTQERALYCSKVADLTDLNIGIKGYLDTWDCRRSKQGQEKDTSHF